MPDPRQNVIPGQRLQIAASQINALNAMIRGPGGFGDRQVEWADPASNIILVRNQSGVIVPWLGVLAIGGPVVDPSGGSLAGEGESNRRAREFTAGPVMNGTTPSGGSQQVAVAIEPIENGKIGRMAISGRFACKVKVLSTSHGYARGRNGDVTQLISAECGPIRLLWTEGQGNDKFAAAMV